MPLPATAISLSNENYNYLVKLADIRKVGLSRVVNDLLSDHRSLNHLDGGKPE